MSSNNAPWRFLALPGHLLALILVLVPGSALVLSTFIPGPSGAMGRSRTFGFITDVGYVPLLGVFLGLLIASLFQHRKTAWAYAIASVLVGLGFLVSLPIFILDVLQLRPGVRPDLKTTYDLNVIRNLGTLSAFTLFLLVLGILAIRALRKDRAEARTATPGLVSAAALRRPVRESEAAPTETQP